MAGRRRERTFQELVDLAASTSRVATQEYRDLANSFERAVCEMTDSSGPARDSAITELGAAFQIVAGQLAQIHVLRAHLDRIFPRDET